MATSLLGSSPSSHRSGARRISGFRRLEDHDMLAWCKETYIDLGSLQPYLGFDQCRNENKIKTRKGHDGLVYDSPARAPSICNHGLPAIITASEYLTLQVYPSQSEVQYNVPL